MSGTRRKPKKKKRKGVMFSIGNKVRLKNHPKKLSGVIKFVSGRPGFIKYLVVYDEENLIPPDGWHYGDDLEAFLDEQLPSGKENEKLTEKKDDVKVCTCGAASIGAPFHSPWCDLNPTSGETNVS